MQIAYLPGSRMLLLHCILLLFYEYFVLNTFTIDLKKLHLK